MRKLNLIAVLGTMLVVGGVVVAEEGQMKGKSHSSVDQKWSGEDLDKKIVRMKEKLKLSADQEKTVKAALEEKRKKMEALMSSIKDQRKAINDEADAKIMAVLNADQNKTYAEMKEKMKAKMDEHHEQHKEMMEKK